MVEHKHQVKGETYLNKLNYKWKKPIYRGMPLCYSCACNMSRNIKLQVTQPNIMTFWDWLFFFPVPNTHMFPPICLMLGASAGGSPDASPSPQTIFLLDLSLSQSHSSIPPVPQSLTLPLDLYHKSFPPPSPNPTSSLPPPILPPLPLTASKSPINPLLGSILLLNNWRCLPPQWKGT